MSYVLDALKKNQVARIGDPMSVNLTPTTQRANFPAVMLSIALFANVILIGAYLLFDRLGDAGIATATPAAEVSVSKPLPKALSVVRADAPTLSASPQVGIETAGVASVQTSRPAPTRSVTDAPRPGAAEPVTAVRIDDLSPGERATYDGFTFTSHIYTDDQDLRAIFIDGEQVKIGDRFKGLRIYDITQTGVIFEENRRGRLRRIEVNPFE